jgi:hypothetical protein
MATTNDIAARYPGVVAEVHYKRRQKDDLISTYCEGILTTQHPASSYGLPVFVAGSNYRVTDPLVPGQAYGPGDLPVGYVMLICPYDYRTDPTCLPVRAAAAGYNCEVAEPADGHGC